MNLDDAQKQKVRTWIDEGLKLAEIQKLLGSEFGLQFTYMEVRFLVDDLKLTPKDPQPLPPVKQPSPAAEPATRGGQRETATPAPAPASDSPKPAAGSVSVSVDTIPLPGSMVSGAVTFSDGQTGKWYIDEMGQLGVAPTVKGYRPPQADMASFQRALQVELQKHGFA